MLLWKKRRPRILVELRKEAGEESAKAFQALHVRQKAVVVVVRTAPVSQKHLELAQKLKSKRGACHEYFHGDSQDGQAEAEQAGAT